MMTTPTDGTVTEEMVKTAAKAYGRPGRFGPSIHEDLMRSALEAAAPLLRAQYEARIAELEGDLDATQSALEHDRSDVCSAVNAIRLTMACYQWLKDGERGPYAYDDKRYIKEFGAAVEFIEAALRPLSRMAADWTNCPTDPEKIKHARLSATESEVRTMREALERAALCLDSHVVTTAGCRACGGKWENIKGKGVCMIHKSDCAVTSTRAAIQTGSAPERDAASKCPLCVPPPGMHHEEYCSRAGESAPDATDAGEADHA